MYGTKSQALRRARAESGRFRVSSVSAGTRFTSCLLLSGASVQGLLWLSQSTSKRLSLTIDAPRSSTYSWTIGFEFAGDMRTAMERLAAIRGYGRGKFLFSCVL